METHTIESLPAIEVRGLRRLVYWVLAALFFALAMLGIVLPGIPTTPFLLLMCYFLLRLGCDLGPTLR